MGAAILALVTVLTLSWFYGERTRGQMTERIRTRGQEVVRLKKEASVAEKEAEKISEKLKSTEERLEDEISTRKGTEKKLEFAILQKEQVLKQCINRSELDAIRSSIRSDLEADYEREKAVLKSRSKELVQEKTRLEVDMRRLSREIVTLKARIKKLTEELLNAKKAALSKQDSLKFENDLLSRRLDETREMLEEARSAGQISDELAGKIKYNLDEAEQTLALTTAGYKQKEGPSVSLEALQDSNREEFKVRLSNLERRYDTLKEDKKVIDDSLSNAMLAVLKMEETVAKIESGLGDSGATEQGLKGMTGPSLEDVQTDAELLRQAKEDVRTALLTVKNTIEGTMGNEAQLLMTETAQTSSIYGSLLSDSVITAGLGVDLAPEETETGMEGQLEELDLKLKDAYKDYYAATPDGQATRLTDMASTIREDCGAQLQELIRAGEELFDVYTVKKGDTLWKISEKIYGNPYLWPLLYKYNFSQLTNPDVLEPKDELILKKDASKKELEESKKALNKAIKKARTKP